jgi:hypothetical protein
VEIKLNLSSERDAYELFVILNNIKNELEQENCNHKDMVKLLEGNKTNDLAKVRLDHENLCIQLNDEKIEIIDNFRTQLEPMVDKYLGLK